MGRGIENPDSQITAMSSVTSSSPVLMFTVSAHRGNGSTGYLIIDSVIRTSDSVYLGRPWGPNSTTVLINNTLSKSIERIGWDE